MWNIIIFVPVPNPQFRMRPYRGHIDQRHTACGVFGLWCFEVSNRRRESLKRAAIIKIQRLDHWVLHLLVELANEERFDSMV